MRLRTHPAYTACARPAGLLRHAVESALDHDMLTVAQATAYASMLALFPSLIVAASLLPVFPAAAPLRLQLALFFDRFLPSTVVPVLGAYFTASPKDPRTATAILSAALVGLFGAVGIVSTFMEGFRRAHNLPLPEGSFWARRLRALALVPLSLLPLALASALIVFGQAGTLWLARVVVAPLHTPIILLSVLIRWSIAIATSIGIVAVLYHLGTNVNTAVRSEFEPLLLHPSTILRREWTWRASLPGAVLATGLWLAATLLFGVYVTRFANYGRVYGPLGAAIALMVWLYLIALSVLIGAEFNAQRAAQQRRLNPRDDIPGTTAVISTEGPPLAP